MLKIYKTHLTQKTQLTADVYLFRFSLDEPRELNFVAGQYMILLIPQPQVSNEISLQAYARRLYSIISSSRQKNSFDLLIKMIPGGVGSTYLANKKVGDEVLFQGPAGMFFLRKNNRPIIFLATGTGIAPIKSMLESYQSINNYQLLFWGLRTYQDVYFLNELKNLKLKNSNFQFFICLSQEKSLEILPQEERKYFILGHVDQGLEKLIAANFNQLQSVLADFDFYLCGSRQVVEFLRQHLEKKSISKNQVFFEKF